MASVSGAAVGMAAAAHSTAAGPGAGHRKEGKGGQGSRRFKKNRRKQQQQQHHAKHPEDGEDYSPSRGNQKLVKDLSDNASPNDGQPPVLRNESRFKYGSKPEHKRNRNRPKKKQDQDPAKEVSPTHDPRVALQGPAPQTLDHPDKNTGNQAKNQDKTTRSEDREPKTEQQGKTTAQVEKDGTKSEKPSSTTATKTKSVTGVTEPAESHMEAEIKELEKEFLFKLRKKSVKFPYARFFCRLCDYHCDTVLICRRHIQDKRHQRLKTIKTTDILLRNLPPPSDSHCACLSRLLETVTQEQSISQADLADRHKAFDTVKSIVQEKLPDVEMSLYGSTVSSFALKDSDLNIDVTMAKSPLVLKDVFLVLREDQSGYFSSVQSDFTSKVPVVKAHISSLGIKCQIGINNSPAVETSKLLGLYSKIDPRVIKLTIAFKYWAKLCKIDQQTAGTLPSYVFGLMVVQFCQQHAKLLPVLHEIETEELTAQRKKPGGEHVYFSELQSLDQHFKCNSAASLGALWIQLLRYYIMDFDLQTHVICIRQKEPLTRQAKKWASKKVAVEDPFFRRRNVARSLSHPSLFEYINDRIRAAYKYFAIPRTKAGPLFDDADPELLQHKLQETMRLLHQKAEKSQSRDHSADAVQHTDKDVGSQGQDEKKEKESSGGPPQSQQQHGQDATATEAESCDDVDSAALSLKALDIASNDAKPGPASEANGDVNAATLTILEKNQKSNATCDQTVMNCDSGHGQNVEKIAAELLDTIIRNSIRDYKAKLEAGQRAATGKADAVRSETEDTDIKDEEEDDDVIVDENSGSDDDDDDDDDVSTNKNSQDLSQPPLVPNGDIADGGFTDESAVSVITADDLVFKFDEDTLTDSQGPALMCSICQKEGHLKQNCPEEVLPELKPLPKMTSQYQKILSSILCQVPRDFEPTPRELQMRDEVVLELETFVRSFYPEAKLALFGSSCNGFGFRDSDLDICMTLNKPTPEGLDCVAIIEVLAQKLKKHKSFFNVFAISTAKVPIVKFKHRRSQLEGDVSLYNTLAQHNTRMLSLYSLIDFRVKILGYTMKVFAKQEFKIFSNVLQLCDICDASRGSLSSYAYTLMVLYYLQQRKPPVIPVLQELHSGPKPEVIVDGWNAWFYNDLQSLPKAWPGFGKNNETAAQLWVGLLCFYSEEFNFNDCVISTRQHALLTKFEKLWNGKCVAIEDPFDLGHNLGVGLSRKMNTFIQRTFRCGRQLFGTPVDRPPPNYHSLQDYLFDPDLLSDGNPPNDRGCRICGKIGHIAKECPVVKDRKDRQERERELRRKQKEEDEAVRNAQQLSGNQGNRGGHGSNRNMQQHGAHQRVSHERPIPQGHPYPDFSNGRSQRPAQQSYQRSYTRNTPPRNMPPSTPPRSIPQGGAKHGGTPNRVVATQVFHSSASGGFSPHQLASSPSQHQQQQQQQQHAGSPMKVVPPIYYLNPTQMIDVPQQLGVVRPDMPPILFPQPLSPQQLSVLPPNWQVAAAVTHHQQPPAPQATAGQPQPQSGVNSQAQQQQQQQQQQQRLQRTIAQPYSVSPNGSEAYRDFGGQQGSRQRNQEVMQGSAGFHGNQPALTHHHSNPRWAQNPASGLPQHQGHR